jgi:hypothetical protein
VTRKFLNGEGGTPLELFLAGVAEQAETLAAFVLHGGQLNSAACVDAAEQQRQA